MNLSQQSQSLIESAIRKAISKFNHGCEQTIVTDIHIQPIQSNGKFYIFDDEDRELAFATIEEWKTDEGDDFYSSIEHTLQTTLGHLKETGEFAKLTIIKPYSFVLIDEEKESISDLLLIDDDTILLNSDLLQGLDEELDDFLKELLVI